MKRNTVSLFICLGLWLSSCQNKQAATDSPASSSEHSMEAAHDTDQAAKSAKEATPELFARLTVQEDPICGMSFAEYPIADTLKTKEGKLYGFCSAHCKDEFEKHQTIN